MTKICCEKLLMIGFCTGSLLILRIEVVWGRPKKGPGGGRVKLVRVGGHASARVARAGGRPSAVVGQVGRHVSGATVPCSSRRLFG